MIYGSSLSHLVGFHKLVKLKTKFTRRRDRRVSSVGVQDLGRPPRRRGPAQHPPQLLSTAHRVLWGKARIKYVLNWNLERFISNWLVMCYSCLIGYRCRTAAARCTASAPPCFPSHQTVPPVGANHITITVGNIIFTERLSIK